MRRCLHVLLVRDLKRDFGLAERLPGPERIGEVLDGSSIRAKCGVRALCCTGTEDPVRAGTSARHRPHCLPLSIRRSLRTSSTIWHLLNFIERYDGGGAAHLPLDHRPRQNPAMTDPMPTETVVSVVGSMFDRPAQSVGTTLDGRLSAVRPCSKSGRQAQSLLIVAP